MTGPSSEGTPTEEPNDEPDDPTTLNELFDYIWFKDDISKGVTFYAIGWVFFDLFERGRHEHRKDGKACATGDLDRFVQELPRAKIDRLIREAEQEFGGYAAEFMEDDTKKRIQAAVNDGVVATVKGYTSGWKTFGMNILAGLVSGVLFAGIALLLYLVVKDDPSLFAIAKGTVQPATTSQPAAP